MLCLFLWHLSSLTYISPQQVFIYIPVALPFYSTLCCFFSSFIFYSIFWKPYTCSNLHSILFLPVHSFACSLFRAEISYICLYCCNAFISWLFPLLYSKCFLLYASRSVSFRCFSKQDSTFPWRSENIFLLKNPIQINKHFPQKNNFTGTKWGTVCACSST